MGKSRYRIGQIVPSSNVTMETEIPALLRARESVLPERFSFHAARMRMKHVTKRELDAMDNQALGCADELSDAAVDIMGYACLAGIMSRGIGYHRRLEKVLADRAAANGHPCPVVSSAGALIEGLEDLGARKVSIIMPYTKPLAKQVVTYIESEGIEVHDAIALEIEDNLAVAAQSPCLPAKIYKKLKTNGVDAIVVSACVQMPSLASVPMVEAMSGLPTVSAAVCTTYRLLKDLKLPAVAPGGGSLLSGHLENLVRVA